MLTVPLGTNLSEIWIEIPIFSFKKMCFKMSLGKWWPFCLGLIVFKTKGYPLMRECQWRVFGGFPKYILLNIAITVPEVKWYPLQGRDKSMAHSKTAVISLLMKCIGANTSCIKPFILVRSLRWACLVTWFSYHVIAKTGAPLCLIHIYFFECDSCFHADLLTCEFILFANLCWWICTKLCYFY